MEDRIILGYGENSGEITNIGLGTWKIPNDSMAGIEAIRHGLDLGSLVQKLRVFGQFLDFLDRLTLYTEINRLPLLDWGVF